MASDSLTTRRAARLRGGLDLIERVGNRLPNPITLFAMLAGVVLATSHIAASIGISAIHPRDGSAIRAIDLLTSANVQRIFTQAVANFTGFAPLGTVLAAMIGVGIAERSGLITAALHTFVMGVPRAFLTSAIVFAGIMAHVAADAGFLIIPPIAAALFASVGRHPLAGLAAGFAGVAGGFSANLLPGTLDVLLAELSHTAADASGLLRPGYRVQVLGNYYFMAASVPILTLVGAWITTHVVEPRLGPWTPEAALAATPSDPHRRRGLIAAGITLLATLGLLAALVAPAEGPLRTEGVNTLQRIQPFLGSMVVLILLVFLLPGLAYGIATGKIRSDHDVARMASETMASMGTYIVLAFFAAQFINYFAWSNLGAILAISGANLLRELGFHGTPLFMTFIVLVAVLNLFISSASAKWAVLAPVFVPMFMQLGYTPEATQVVYRIGDSCTNIVTPLLPYLPIILTFAQRYDANIRAGTLIAMMIPYSAAFLIVWSAMLMGWLKLGLPLGPGVGLAY